MLIRVVQIPDFGAPHDRWIVTSAIVGLSACPWLPAERTILHTLTGDIKIEGKLDTWAGRIEVALETR